jgi:hypothetical protein
MVMVTEVSLLSLFICGIFTVHIQYCFDVNRYHFTEAVIQVGKLPDANLHLGPTDLDSLLKMVTNEKICGTLVLDIILSFLSDRYLGYSIKRSTGTKANV